MATEEKRIALDSNDHWFLPKGDKVPEFGSPEYLRLIQYDRMTAEEKYRRTLQHNMHVY